VRKDPQAIARIELIALHDLDAESLGALKKKELVYAHLADDAREERERQLDHRMEPYEAADSRVHFLDWYRGVAAAERVNPTPGFNRVGHHAGRLLDRIHLGFLNAVHDAAYVRQPLCC
jgi:hypothetical protein